VKPLAQPLIWINPSFSFSTLPLQSSVTSLDFWAYPGAPFHPTTWAFPYLIRLHKHFLGCPSPLPFQSLEHLDFQIPKSCCQTGSHQISPTSYPCLPLLSPGSPTNYLLKPYKICRGTSSGMVMIQEKNGLLLAGRKSASQSPLEDLASGTLDN
jgi:hypothetical protein